MPQSPHPGPVRLAVIAGDGIGPEVVAEGLKVLEAAVGRRGRRSSTTEYDLGARRWHATGETLPDSVLDGDPRPRRDPARRGRRPGRAQRRPRARPAAAAALRARPLRQPAPGPALPRASPRPLAATPARSTSSSSARAPRAPTSATAARCAVGTPHEIATEVSVNTALRRRAGRPRRVRAAPPRRPRQQLTLVHKHNVLIYAGHLWRRTVERGRRGVPRGRRTDYLHVDAATIFLATDPARFDVIVTDNLFGDIITDLAAAITGGIGLAASAATSTRTAPRPSMFEPVHGSAPGHRRPGQGRPDRDDPVGRDAARAPRPADEAAARSSRPSPPTSPSARRRRRARTAEIGDAIAARVAG